MKVFFAALGCLSICAGLVFGAAEPLPQFVGHYVGVFEPIHCKKGHTEGGGTFGLVVQANGAASGYIANGLGSVPFTGKCSKNGAVVGTYSVLGHNAKIRVKIDKAGLNIVGKAMGVYCKYGIVGGKL